LSEVPNCPECGVESRGGFLSTSVAKFFGYGKADRESRYCPKCERVLDPSSPTGFINYLEVRRRARANLRWHQYTDGEIERFIEGVEREPAEYKRVARLRYLLDYKMRARQARTSSHTSGTGIRYNSKLSWLGFDHSPAWLRPTPLLGPLSPEEEEQAEKRLKFSWERGLLRTKMTELPACTKCGARLFGQNRFCEECGAESLSPLDSLATA